MRITLCFAVLALAVCGGFAQQFGDRIKGRGSRQSVSQNNGYFYPEPSPSFTLPPAVPTTTTTTTTQRPRPTTEAVELEYLPPTTQRPSYIQCFLPQQCLTAQACSSRGSTYTSNGNCQVGGQVGVCCNPVPITTTLPPRTTQAPTTTVPPRTTTQPAYIQCYAPQQCLTAQACSSQGSTYTSNGNCQVGGGQVGVCCNPAPTTTLPPRTTTRAPTTTVPPRTTTQPAYVQCAFNQACVSPLECGSNRPEGPSGNCQIGFGGQLGVCCSRATTTVRPVTTTRPTAPPAQYLPPVTTTQTYSYPEPEEPLQFPDSNKENPFIAVTVRPPPPTTARPTTQRPVTQPVLSAQEEEILFWDFRESIPGDPETDYPILDKIPKTAFTCKGKIDGFYADEETRCQVFHVCSNIPEADPIQNSFLCPNGTIFNQESFVCQWWPDVNCASSSQFVQLNSNIGVVPAASSSHGTQIKSSAGASFGAGQQQLPSITATAGVSVSSHSPQY